MSGIEFEQLATFIRDWHHLPPDIPIGPETRFETDLGITGDDGVELLAAIQKEYGVSFSEKTFGLERNEHLFYSEGFGILAAVVDLSSKESARVRALTVGELYNAISSAVIEGQRST